MAIAIVVCDGEWYVCCCCCVLSCSLLYKCKFGIFEFCTGTGCTGVPSTSISGIEVTVCPLKTMGSGSFQVLSDGVCELYGTAFSVNR